MTIHTIIFKTSVVLLMLLTALNSHSQNWTQVGSDIDGTGNEVYVSGVDLSADGSKMVIGESGYNTGAGRVRVFELISGNWQQIGIDLYGEALGNGLGISVRVTPDGNTIVCGEARCDVSGAQSGQVRVYFWDGVNWQPKGSWIQGITDAEFGGSVDINQDGTRIAIGAPFPSNTNGVADIGMAQVYEWTGSDWVQLGANLMGDAAGDLFGAHLSMDTSGNVVAISGINNSSSKGHVRVFEWNGSAWIQRGTDLTGVSIGDYYGTGVSMSADGNSVAIGASSKDIMGTDDGMVQVFNWNGSSWVQKGVDLIGVPGDSFGHSVDLNSSGDVLAIGVPFSDAFGLDAGVTRIYKWDGTDWMTIGSDIGGEAVYDYSGGLDISLNDDGTYVAILAYGNDAGGNYAGQVRVFSSPFLNVQKNKNENPFLVFPNPSHDVINIPTEVFNSNSRIEVTNSLGQKLIVSQLTNIKDQQVNVAFLEAGLYFISLIDNSETVYSSSFIKR